MASADTIPLPISKHLPGKNKRPDDGLLESVAEKACTVTEDASYRSNTAWLYGIRLFNNGYYWEAHEVLEAVWNNATPNSREKHLVQGVIQIANAQLKAHLQQAKAADRLQKLATECITRAYIGTKIHTDNTNDKQADDSHRLMGLESAQMHAAAAQCNQLAAAISLQLN